MESHLFIVSHSASKSIEFLRQFCLSIVSMKNGTEIAQAKKFAQKNVLATIATVNVDTFVPEAAIVYYWYDNRNNIYLATLRESRKITNIETNDNVAIVIGNENSGKTLQFEGTSQILTDSKETVSVLEILHKNIKEHQPHLILWPMLQLHPQGICLMKVTISWFRFSSFTDPIFTVEGTGSDLLTGSMALE